MRRPKPYHHGNLREVLLEAAVRLVAEVGPAGFTLREVARRAGVSHNAPYRHFRDRDDLMAAVATQGFNELTEAMLQEAGKVTGPVDRLKRAGLAYIAFALRRPEHFAVMFDVPASQQKNPALAEAGDRALKTLVNFVRDCLNEGCLPAGGDLLRLTLLAWTMVHGIAKLAIADRLPYKSKSDILKFAEFVINESLPVRRR